MEARQHEDEARDVQAHGRRADDMDARGEARERPTMDAGDDDVEAHMMAREPAREPARDQAR